MRTIARAAIRVDGVVHSVAPPGDHARVIWKIAGEGGKTPVIGEQGFLTSDGEFVGREEAARIVIEAKQPLRFGFFHLPGEPTRLSSEDLW